MLTLRKPDIWIPTALEMENCKKTIAGMVMKKFPWVKPQDAHGDLCQIAFNEGYEVYMRKAPEMQIKHPDMWVVEAGYKRGLTYAVKVLDRGKREIDMPQAPAASTRMRSGYGGVQATASEGRARSHAASVRFRAHGRDPMTAAPCFAPNESKS